MNYLLKPKFKKYGSLLSTDDINNVLETYSQTDSSFTFLGTHPCDLYKIVDLYQEMETIMKKNPKSLKFGIVFNLDKHDQGGSHWTSMFIDIENQFIFYFDSAANELPTEVNTLVKKIKSQGQQLSNPIQFKFYSNKNHRHQSSNTECGMYSLYLIITLIKDTHNYNFFKETKITDNAVENLRDRYFNNDV